jgi:hypothetical protein
LGPATNAVTGPGRFTPVTRCSRAKRINLLCAYCPLNGHGSFFDAAKEIERLRLRDLGRYGWAEHWEAVFRRFDEIEALVKPVPNVETIAALEARRPRQCNVPGYWHIRPASA